MICYRDTTFCAARDCSKFTTCGAALTEYVSMKAEQIGLPIARFTHPERLSCYKPIGGTIAVEKPKFTQPRSRKAAQTLYGDGFDPSRCIRAITDSTGLHWQCGHPAGKGNRKLYCPKHA
jgi:hypothetical protein